jgi:hypothetical protein
MIKAGEDGADIDRGVGSLVLLSGLSPGCSSEFAGRSDWDFTLRDKFLVLRGRLLGDRGLEPPRPGLGGTMSRSRCAANRLLFLKEGRGIVGLGESGDESGVWRSSVVADATVEIVVVGEELLEEDAEVETLL